MLAVLILLLALLMMRYTGRFDNNMKVTAVLGTTGDGLPANADVKYRGVLVGTVDSVDVAAQGVQQRVNIEMAPDHIGGVPDTVTARVVPSNLFAITSIELVDNGPSAPLQAGDEIAEDTSKGTIALQTTLTSLRSIADRIDPVQLGTVLGSLSAALDGRDRAPGSTIVRLDRWLTAVDAAFPDLGADLQNFAAAANGINASAPELIGVLNESIVTANTITEKRAELVTLLASAGGTVGTVNTLFARNPDSAKVAVSGMDDVFGALVTDPAAIPDTIANLNQSLRQLYTTFHWGPSQQMVWSADISFTPFKVYTRADCPRYGDLAGPSCYTAPTQNNPGVLPPELMPRRLDSAGPVPAAVTAAPDPSQLIPQLPGLPLPDLPQLPQLPPPGLPAPQPAPAQPAAAPASADLRGPAAISALLGRTPNATQLMLLGAALQGGTVTIQGGAAP